MRKYLHTVPSPGLSALEPPEAGCVMSREWIHAGEIRWIHGFMDHLWPRDFQVPCLVPRPGGPAAALHTYRTILTHSTLVARLPPHRLARRHAGLLSHLEVAG